MSNNVLTNTSYNLVARIYISIAWIQAFNMIDFFFTSMRAKIRLHYFSFTDVQEMFWTFCALLKNFGFVGQNAVDPFNWLMDWYRRTVVGGANPGQTAALFANLFLVINLDLTLPEPVGPPHKTL